MQSHDRRSVPSDIWTLQSLGIPSFKSAVSLNCSGLKAEKRKAEAQSNPEAKGKSKAKRAKKDDTEIKPEVKAEGVEVKAEDDANQDMDDDLHGSELEDDDWWTDMADAENFVNEG